MLKFLACPLHLGNKICKSVEQRSYFNISEGPNKLYFAAIAGGMKKIPSDSG